jgi:hypothetical protein
MIDRTICDSVTKHAKQTLDSLKAGVSKANYMRAYGAYHSVKIQYMVEEYWNPYMDMVLEIKRILELEAPTYYIKNKNEKL